MRTLKNEKTRIQIKVVKILAKVKLGNTLFGVWGDTPLHSLGGEPM